MNIFKKFIESKRYVYFLPKFLRYKIFNIKKLKIYHTKTGSYYLPQYAIKDIIRNTIIADQIFDAHILELAKKYIKPNTIVLDLGSNRTNRVLKASIQAFVLSTEKHSL